MDSKQLRQDVLDELDFEPSLDASNIGVSATDTGVVTLTGHVRNYLEKVSAVSATKRLKGVRGVADEIEVRFPGSRIADDEIAKRAVNTLRWDAAVPDTVQVTVSNGSITLSGEVDWQFQRAAAETNVRRLDGVTSVINRVTLKPRPAVQLAAVKSQILNALKRHAETEARDIRISVKDGNRVTLEGKVDNWDERYAVEDAAWSAAGVASVDNRLTIH
jgi:osmotically-inducible protein OsmY